MIGPEMYKVIERDPYGNVRELSNQSTNPWTGTFTKDQAERTVKWREEHISRKYRYEIVPAAGS